MVEYKINSKDMPKVKGQAEMVLAAMITEEGGRTSIENVITGLASAEDMAEAMGKLVGNIAHEAGIGKGFILAVTIAATDRLMEIECEGER